MKNILLSLLIFPFTIHAQTYSRAASDSFVYKEIGDTIFVNKTFLVPGDTLFLGKGSAPDHSFLNIYEAKPGFVFFNRLRYLPAAQSEKYLIYKERRKSNSFFGSGYADYIVLFISPGQAGKTYAINWYSSIETHEIRLSAKIP